jgi:hypothetical protein
LLFVPFLLAFFKLKQKKQEIPDNVFGCEGIVATSNAFVIGKDIIVFFVLASASFLFILSFGSSSTLYFPFSLVSFATAVVKKEANLFSKLQKTVKADDDYPQPMLEMQWRSDWGPQYSPEYTHSVGVSSKARLQSCSYWQCKKAFSLKLMDVVKVKYVSQQQPQQLQEKKEEKPKMKLSRREQERDKMFSIVIRNPTTAPIVGFSCTLHYESGLLTKSQQFSFLCCFSYDHYLVLILSVSSRPLLSRCSSWQTTATLSPTRLPLVNATR